MKTQNFGTSRLYWTCAPSEGFTAPRGALKNYRENRENGDEQDSPKYPFPSYGLENITCLGFDKSFIYEGNKQRGPEKFKGSGGQVGTRNYYVVKHKQTGTVIAGFSYEPDLNKANDGDDLYIHLFTDTDCLEIRQWMEEKDLNYLRRIKSEKPILFQKEFEELKAITPRHLAIFQLHEEAKAEKQHLTEEIASLAMPASSTSLATSSSLSPELAPAGTQLPQSSRYSLGTSHTLFAAPEIIPETSPTSSVESPSDSDSNHTRCCCVVS